VVHAPAPVGLPRLDRGPPAPHRAVPHQLAAHRLGAAGRRRPVRHDRRTGGGAAGRRPRGARPAAGAAARRHGAVPARGRHPRAPQEPGAGARCVRAAAAPAPGPRAGAGGQGGVDGGSPRRPAPPPPGAGPAPPVARGRARRGARVALPARVPVRRAVEVRGARGPGARGPRTRTGDPRLDGWRPTRGGGRRSGALRPRRPGRAGPPRRPPPRGPRAPRGARAGRGRAPDPHVGGDDRSGRRAGAGAGHRDATGRPVVSAGRRPVPTEPVTTSTNPTPMHTSHAGSTARQDQGPEPDRILLGVTAVAVAVGTVLRFLPRSGMWLDEALTANIADLPIGEIPEALRRDGHPPLFYVLTHLWASIGGRSDWWLRALPGVCSMLSLPLTYLAGRRLASRAGAEGLGARRTGLAALAIAAVMPFGIRYAAELRMYSLVILLVTGGYLLADDLLSGRLGSTARGLAPRAAGAALVAATLLWTHYWSMWFLAAVGLLALWRVWRAPDAPRRAG